MSRLLVIPPEQFKSGVSHRVPLSIDAAALIEGLPRHTGPYVFTTTLGAKAISGWSRAKQEIDRVMTRELGHAPRHWVLHDMRHTIRIAHGRAGRKRERRRDDLGHAKRGMGRVYDEHATRMRCARPTRHGPGCCEASPRRSRCPPMWSRYRGGVTRDPRQNGGAALVR